MPEITGLEAQKKNKERVNVYVDDAFFCGLSLDDVVRLKLVNGLVLAEHELGHIASIGEENKFFTKALEYLLRSPKTEFQVKQYLYKKQIETVAVNKIIERLKSLNYLNDELYVEDFVRAKEGKLGRKVIKQKLAQKGIYNAEIEVGDQTDACLAVAEKYIRNKELTSENMAKMCRYLFGKGFDYDIINSVREKICR